MVVLTIYICCDICYAKYRKQKHAARQAATSHVGCVGQFIIVKIICQTNLAKAEERQAIEEYLKLKKENEELRKENAF